MGYECSKKYANGLLKGVKEFRCSKQYYARTYDKKDASAEVLVKIHTGRPPAMPDYL